MRTPRFEELGKLPATIHAVHARFAEGYSGVDRSDAGPQERCCNLTLTSEDGGRHGEALQLGTMRLGQNCQTFSYSGRRQGAGHRQTSWAGTARWCC